MLTASEEFRDKGKALVHHFPNCLTSITSILLHFWPRKERSGFDGGLSTIHDLFTTLPWLILLLISEHKWSDFAARDKVLIANLSGKKEAGSHRILRERDKREDVAVLSRQRVFPMIQV